GLESELPDSLVEQALRCDVSLLFEDSAEAAAQASAAHYNSEWAKELLDQCEAALEEEMRRRKVELANRQSAPMLVSFSRVCTIDPNGNSRPIINDLSVATNLDDAVPDADVWSRLLNMSNSDKAVGVSNESNDKNRLRIRKRKVDYMVDDIHEATDDIKAQKTSHTLTYDDSDFVDTPGMDVDEDGDLSDVAAYELKVQSNATLPVIRAGSMANRAKSQARVAPPPGLSVVLITPSELCELASAHADEVIQMYINGSSSISSQPNPRLDTDIIPLKLLLMH
ncbi:hypothetical protein GGF37_003830, partial [Kickxella alabastrina]